MLYIVGRASKQYAVRRPLFATYNDDDFLGAHGGGHPYDSFRSLGYCRLCLLACPRLIQPLDEAFDPAIDDLLGMAKAA